MTSLKDDQYVIALKEASNSRNWRYLCTYGLTRQENTFTTDKTQAIKDDPATMELRLVIVQHYYPKAETQFV